MYKLVFSDKARKELKSFPKLEALKIIVKISELSYPFKSHLNITKLTGTRYSYRLRIGRIRVLFEVHQTTKNIWITKIRYRKDVYRFS